MPVLTPNDPDRREDVLDAEKVEAAKAELVSYSQVNNIPSLEDRVNFGLDPVGILALSETNEKARELCRKIADDTSEGHAVYEDLLKMCNYIQVAGPWAYAEQLQNATEPHIRAWMILKASNKIMREMVLPPNEFIDHVDTVKNELDNAIADPDKYFEGAKIRVLEQSQTRFREPEENVPITEMDGGYTAMAIKGYKAGIYQNADGLLFVGSSIPVENELFERWGLKAENRQDRGREVTVYLNNREEVLAKRVHPGFVVILSRSFRLAAEVVKAINNPNATAELSEEALGHTLFTPTSLNPDDEEESLPEEEVRALDEALTSDAEAAERVSIKDQFYRAFTLVKSQVISKDALINLQRKYDKKAAKKAARTGEHVEPRQVSGADIVKTKIKVESKMAEKAEELKYLQSLIEEELKNLPPDVRKVLDMAGGTGDLALATAMTMLENGRPIDEARIIDPFAYNMNELRDFIIHYLPLSGEFKRVIKVDNMVLQEAEITPDSLVVAKHPCGTLADDIIEQWVESDSPTMVVMTCCQHKAKDLPARYDISQEDWADWCKKSAWTNSDNEEQRKQGMEAMLKLDQARVAYLKRHGFEAELHTNPDFHKGDVIIARRKAA